MEAGLNIAGCGGTFKIEMPMNRSFMEKVEETGYNLITNALTGQLVPLRRNNSVKDQVCGLGKSTSFLLETQSCGFMTRGCGLPGAEAQRAVSSTTISSL